MTEEQLQRLLSQTAAALAYPPTPDLRAAVRRRIGRSAPARRFVPATAMLALVLLALAAALVLPGSRYAIARFFGVEGSRIERLPAGATPAAAGRPSNLDAVATPVSGADAFRLAGSPPVMPNDELLQTYIANYGSQSVVIWHYQRFDLWQTQMQQLATFGKQVPPDGVVRDVMVGPYDARWLTGEHYVYYQDASGRVINASQRTVTRHTLVWRTSNFFYRIETDLSLDETLRIARTLP